MSGTATFVVFALLAFFPLYRRLLPWPDGTVPILDAFTAYTAPPVSVLLGLLLFAWYLPQNWVRRLRLNPGYQRALWVLKEKVTPFLSAFGLTLLAVEFGAHYAFNLHDSFGGYCRESAAIKDAPHGFQDAGNRWRKEFVFDTSPDASNLPNNVCVSTGVFVNSNTNYRISVMRIGEPWTFFGEPSYMGGQPIARLPFLKKLAMTIMFPLQRTLDRPWGAFILRIGGRGNEEDLLDRDPPAQSDDILADTTTLGIPETEDLGEPLRPKRDGELFVYLNKPVFSWLGRLIGNTGKAKITIDYPK